MATHDEWGTPNKLWDMLDAEFDFDLDAAATAQTRKVKRYLGPGSPDGENALSSPWPGRSAWCNPPYSGHNIASFLTAAWHEVEGVPGKTAVLLIPTYTDPRYWSDIIVPHADEVRNLVGRLSFHDFLTGKKMNARYPSSIVVFRGRTGRQVKNAHVWSWDWRVS